LALNIFSIPNGAKRSVVAAKYYKSEGLTAGVADIFIAVPNDYNHGFFIEFKSLNGSQTKSQKAFMDAVEKQNYCYNIVRSLEDFINLITLFYHIK
jgi:hypothetical protein